MKRILLDISNLNCAKGTQVSEGIINAIQIGIPEDTTYGPALEDYFKDKADNIEIHVERWRNLITVGTYPKHQTFTFKEFSEDEILDCIANNVNPWSLLPTL
jgi:hypothetical protein